MTTLHARDGVALAVHENGSGPDLLCVPGGPGRAVAYLEDLGGLSAGRRLLLLDCRGTGRSELPAERESLQFPNLAADLVDVQAGLGLETVDVLAHSAGCAVALLHAVRRPQSVSRLVLVTPGGRPFALPSEDIGTIRASRAEEPWYADAAAAAAALDDVPPRMRAELERETRPFWYGRWDERCQEHAASSAGQMSLRAAAGFLPGPDYDAEAARESLRSIDVPTLIVAGERDALTGVAVAHALADLLPKAEVVVLPRAGHFPWVDEPDAFRDTAEAFLSR